METTQHSEARSRGSLAVPLPGASARSLSGSPIREPGVVVRDSWLGPTPEEDVLKAGLVAIRDCVGDEGLLTFHRRPNGAPVLMRQGFFERLLRGEVSLQDCPAADASAAEADVGKLSLCQLLAIRCRHIDFIPSGIGRASKGSFLLHVDRLIMARLAQRLLGGELATCTDAHVALTMLHVVLIYGAADELKRQITPFHQRWWLLNLDGVRRYLNLARCQMSATAPAEPVHCYRSHTSFVPLDPKRRRVFRWQVLLIQEAENWAEDPLSFEKSGKDHAETGSHENTSTHDIVASHEQNDDSQETGAATTPLACTVKKGSLLFNDFDIEDFFAELSGDDETLSVSRLPSGTGRERVDTDIDTFFDSLLNDPLFDKQVVAPSQAVQHVDCPSSEQVAGSPSVTPRENEVTAGVKSVDFPSDVNSCGDRIREITFAGRSRGSTRVQEIASRLEIAEQARIEAAATAESALEKLDQFQHALEHRGLLADRQIESNGVLKDLRASLEALKATVGHSFYMESSVVDAMHESSRVNQIISREESSVRAVEENGDLTSSLLHSSLEGTNSNTAAETEETFRIECDCNVIARQTEAVMLHTGTRRDLDDTCKGHQCDLLDDRRGQHTTTQIEPPVAVVLDIRQSLDSEAFAHVEEETQGPERHAFQAFVLRREVDVLREQLKQAKEQCKSLQWRLGDRSSIFGTSRVHNHRIRRWTVELDRHNVQQQKEELEAENARLEDRARNGAALYVCKIQELKEELSETQRELEQALEDQRALQQDSAAKTLVIQNLLQRCEPGTTRVGMLQRLTKTFPHKRRVH